MPSAQGSRDLKNNRIQTSYVLEKRCNGNAGLEFYAEQYFSEISWIEIHMKFIFYHLNHILTSFIMLRFNWLKAAK